MDGLATVRIVVRFLKKRATIRDPGFDVVQVPQVVSCARVACLHFCHDALELMHIILHRLCHTLYATDFLQAARDLGQTVLTCRLQTLRQVMAQELQIGHERADGGLQKTKQKPGEEHIFSPLPVSTDLASPPVAPQAPRHHGAVSG